MAIITRLMSFHFTVLLLTACVNIPPESISVNEKVSAGVATMEENTNLVITAWRETAVALLEEKFDDIYDAAEKKYRSKRSIASNQPLNDDQVRDVAIFVMLVNEQVRSKIDKQVADMRRVSQQNSAAIKGANDSITNLLQSAQAVISGREAAIKDVTNLLPIPADVTDFISKAKKVALDAL